MQPSPASLSNPSRGSLLVNPHKIRPPDYWFRGVIARYRIWLLSICIFILICPKVGSQFISVIDDYTRNYAERILSFNSEFPRRLEGLELGFVSRSGSNPLSVVYNLSPNNESWLFVTPCSHPNYTLTIQSFLSSNESREPNVTNVNSQKPFDKWYIKIRKLDMKYSSGFGEKINLNNWKRQEMHVKNLILGVMRLFIDKTDPLPAVYMIRQYSGLIDAFYPRIPPEPFIRICVKDESTSTLSIFVSRAFNADQYCASFNLIENLPNFCSAQLRIDEKHLERIDDYRLLKIRRPSIFDDYYTYRKVSKIQKSEFRCFKTNTFEVDLDKTYQNSVIFINIYAVNTNTKFTDAYEPMEYRWGQFQHLCKEYGRKIIIDKLHPHLWIMGNETVLFNISDDSNSLHPNKLLYQSCVSSQGEILKVFQQENSETPCCVSNIINKRLTALCTKFKPGMYRLQHTLSTRPQHTMPVGQLYFLPDSLSSFFPHLDCNISTDFSMKVHQIPFNNSKTEYTLFISFNRVPSHDRISYYFHIVDFLIPNDGGVQFEVMSQIESKFKAKRNFCKFVRKNYDLPRPVHVETLEGRGCSDSLNKSHLTSIPGTFSANNTYAVLVYFSRSTDSRLDYVQFYSNRIFTMSSDEDVF